MRFSGTAPAVTTQNSTITSVIMVTVYYVYSPTISGGVTGPLVFSATGLQHPANSIGNSKALLISGTCAIGSWRAYHGIFEKKRRLSTNILEIFTEMIAAASPSWLPS